VLDHLRPHQRLPQPELWHEIYVLEDRCMGKGDAACHLIGRTREEWGDERAEELRFFEPPASRTASMSRFSGSRIR
jgi:hypothetical protein